jgi:hypothetical protein
VWGGLHGVYLVLETMLKPLSDKAYSLLKITKNTFSFKLYRAGTSFLLVVFAWIFFRANTVTEAFSIVENLFVFNPSVLFGEGLFNMGMDQKDFYISIISLFLLVAVHWFQRDRNLYLKLQQQWTPIRWGVYLGILLIVMIFGIYGNEKQADFIYFQF